MQDDTVLTASVGALPGDPDSLAAAATNALGFQLVGVCTEGAPSGDVEYEPAPCYTDYNVMLEDPAIQLVIVEGDIEKRRDFAVRALNAGRHVLCALPFAETAPDGVRIMKTALDRDLIATSFLPWRNDPDFAAARSVVDDLDLRPVEELHINRAAPAGNWSDSLLAVMDQANLVVRTDVASVAVHSGSAGLLHMPLRDDNAVIARIGPLDGMALPSFALTARGRRAHVANGEALVTDGDRVEPHPAPEPVDFWENLHWAINGSFEIACHPVDIVRAMRLQEAALEALETGRPGTV